MLPARKRKLTMILFVLGVLSIVTALVLYALRQNISLFYTPAQVASGEAPLHRSVRIGGMVEKGSIVRAEEGLEVHFKVTDFDKSVEVIYNGILPDLFRDGQGVVAEGEVLDAHRFKAVRVLAKHDENYMPPEVKAALGKKVPS